jgi:hypothetical protein
LGRLVGFGLLSSLGLAILAAVVLLPPYVRVLNSEYQLGCERALNADYQDRKAAGELFIEDIRSLDIVAIRTLESSVLGSDSLSTSRQNPSVIQRTSIHAMDLPPNPRPEPVPAWLTRLSTRVTQPNVRRGLFVLAAAAILAGVVLFWGPARARGPKPVPAAS